MCAGSPLLRTGDGGALRLQVALDHVRTAHAVSEVAFLICWMSVARSLTPAPQWSYMITPRRFLPSCMSVNAWLMSSSR